MIRSIMMVLMTFVPSSTNICRPADAFSAGIIAHLQTVVTGSDAGNSKLRAAYRLPLVTTSPAVELVADESVCASAKSAVEDRFTDGTTVSQVYVFRIGTTRIAATAAQPSGGEGLMVFVFDSSYSYLATIQ